MHTPQNAIFVSVLSQKFALFPHFAWQLYAEDFEVIQSRLKGPY